MSTPLEIYVALRRQLNRAAEHADAGDWEESLAAVDEARLMLQRLERLGRNTPSPKPRAAAWARS